MNIEIIKHKGGLYTLQVKYKINTNISEAWTFFTRADNIERIMPPELNFNVTSSKPTNIYEGKIITFNTKIIPFYSTNIVSEITKISYEKYFVDQQISGPYKIWHHEHHFKKTENNTTIIIEKIKYKLYLHPFSRIIHKLLVKNKLINIFKYRTKETQKILDNKEL
tara:strand:+ start:309 stop:806 length:498 start_codon:yes stop_codon:yes gene_type:complete